MREYTTRKVAVFDTTLRDGEQAPGCSMNLAEKLAVARRLELLGVDVIEAGFPAASAGELEAVRAIAGMIKQTSVAGLCRARVEDIDACRIALSKAAQPRIHIFLATSPLHMHYKLKMTPKEVYEQACAAVSYAACFCHDIEFSAEDSFRSEWDFVAAVFAGVIKAGATVVNAPDTVGYAMPDEFERFISYIKERTAGIEKVKLSVHCHNDLGLAVANSLAAVRAGADQVECTINGIGERAGNASLEELVMGLQVRRDFFKVETGIKSELLYLTSRLVSHVTGIRVPPNKAIVGDNIFAHESGIHQHGLMANRATYEIMTPQEVGMPHERIVLGKHSGLHAFTEHLSARGFRLEQAALEQVFAQFKALGDLKKVISERDIEALVMGVAIQVPETWKLNRWVVNSGSNFTSTCTIRLEQRNGTLSECVSTGAGPIDSAFKAINQIIGKDLVLLFYDLKALSSGEDAQAETTIKIAWQEQQWNGRGLSTDIVESSIKAYIAAINVMEYERELAAHLAAKAAESDKLKQVPVGAANKPAALIARQA
ncbi:MAG: 2-isopropylmalate synthase [Spirochaetaceae bacterium]|jgi:2-isopropylmalate synthase|nr:2-isopropylmalate synthase [Spirochaetaceae bacterium]